jgi:hypothetical protein
VVELARGREPYLTSAILLTSDGCTFLYCIQQNSVLVYSISILCMKGEVF